MTDTPNIDSSDADDDCSRESTPRPRQGNGRWLEEKLVDALDRWGYNTVTRERLLGLETDVIGAKKQFENVPEDYIVAECKNWWTTPIGENVIIRLCLQAFVARAMPVLCHTSHLTERAWKLAQIYDVRLLTLDELSKDSLPPLTDRRPPSGTYSHRREMLISDYRSYPPKILWRGCTDLEGPPYTGPAEGPCYVADRTGHNDYVSAIESDYDFG